jgi:hypothetical protein
MSTEASRWLLVDGFVNNFNDYREANFSPSDLICADSQCTATQERQKDFYSFLEEELIDNCHDSARRRNRGPDGALT